MNLLYIDPGTGSLLFSVIIGISAALFFFLKNFIIKIKFLLFNKKLKQEKHRNIVIYNEDNRYWPVFCDILDEFENRKITLSYLTSSKTDPVFNYNYSFIHPEFIGSGNKAFITLNFLDANLCLMTTPGIDVFQLKRSKLCRHYSHILHDVGDVTCYKLFGLDWFDSVLLSGEYQKKDIRELEELRSTKEKELFVVGSTYLDYYNNKIKNIIKEENHIFTVLIAPSWGPGSLLVEAGEKLLDNFHGTDWRIIIRPHPQSKKSEPELLKKLNNKFPDFIWDYNAENLNSLFKADIMISDFSGIIFDYIFLFERPVIYNNAFFNKNLYDAGDLDHDPWKFNIIKNIGVEFNTNNINNLKCLISDTIQNNILIDNIKIAKNTAWQNINKSAGITVDKLLEINANIL